MKRAIPGTAARGTVRATRPARSWRAWGRIAAALLAVAGGVGRWVTPTPTAALPLAARAPTEGHGQGQGDGGNEGPGAGLGTPPDPAKALARKRPAEQAAEVDQLVRRLGAGSEEERDGAEVSLALLEPEQFPLIESALKTPGLNAEARTRLKALVERERPRIPARLRRAKVYRDEWAYNERTMLEAYDRVGKKSPQWDETVRRGIRALVAPPGYVREGEARELLGKAISAGCDDPLVLYLGARAMELAGVQRGPEFDRFYLKAAEGMAQSDYPAFRKAYAQIRYAKFKLAYEIARARAAAPAGASGPLDAETNAVVSRMVNQALEQWPRVVKEEPTNPLLESLADMLLSTFDNQHADRKVMFDQLYGPLEQAMPGKPLPLVFKGRFYVNYAWDARGSGYSNTVTPEGWKLMADRLAVAEEALTRAYELDPNDPAAATEMLGAELGQGKGREVMEKWFKRAMAADPDNLTACKHKMYYLEPKWHGDNQAMILFAQECFESKNWRGGLPFMTIDRFERFLSYVVDDHRAVFWRDGQVWWYVRAWYVPLLAARPANAVARSGYAYYACCCGQWAEADRQFKLLGDSAVPGAFGGREALEKARKEAAERAAAKAGGQ